MGEVYKARDTRLDRAQFAFPPRAGPRRLFDVSPDGQRFVAIRSIAQKHDAAQPNQVRMILNWDQELQRLAPAKR